MPTAQSADRSESDEGEEKDCCNASNDESMDYDANQMVIYTHEDPKVLLVGSVIYVVRYKGSKDDYLMLHRYGYASQGQAAWNLDYTKPFAPGYIDRKDDSYVFTFKPRKAWEKVEHHNVEPGNVKAKFVLNKKKVPPTALRGGGTAAVQQPVQVNDYLLAREQRMKDNNDVMLSLGLIDLAKKISIEHEPVKRAKTIIKKGETLEPGPRRGSRRVAVGRADHDGEPPDRQATRTKNDEGGEDDEDDEDDEDEEDEEDEEED